MGKMEKERKETIKKIAKVLKISYLEACEEIMSCNTHKNDWYKSGVANYNSNWFCLQTACDFYDFTKPGLEKVFEVLKIENKRILDVGAGTGLGMKFICEHSKNCKVFYNNLKGKQYKIAKEILSKEIIDFLICDIFEIKERFEVIFAFEFFEHFKDPCQAFEQLQKNTNAEMIIMQNSFGAFGYGHFPEYRIGGKIVKNNLAKYAFNDWLKQKRYKINEINNSRVVVVTK